MGLEELAVILMTNLLECYIWNLLSLIHIFGQGLRIYCADHTKCIGQNRLYGKENGRNERTAYHG